MARTVTTSTRNKSSSNEVTKSVSSPATVEVPVTVYKNVLPGRGIKALQKPTGLEISVDADELGGSTVVATMADLEDLADTDLDDGHLVFVASISAMFEFRRTTSFTVIPMLVVESFSGTGRWMRQMVPALRWQKQENWFIDAVAGDDEALGNSDTVPIKTQAEWQRRTGGRLMVAYQMFITFISNSAENMFWHVDTTAAGTSFGFQELLIKGSAITPIFTGAVSSIQNWNQDTATKGQFTCVGLSAHVGKRGRWLTGANTGKYFWVVSDLGSDVCRFSPTPSSAFGGAGMATVTNGDTFCIEDLIVLSGEQTFGGPGSYGGVQLNHLSFSYYVDIVRSISPSFKFCKIGGVGSMYLSRAHAYAFCCYIAGSGVQAWDESALNLDHCWIGSGYVGVRPGRARLTDTLHTSVTGGHAIWMSAINNDEPASNVAVYGSCIIDVAGGGVQVGPESSLNLHYGRLWGTTTTVGITTHFGSRIFYQESVTRTFSLGTPTVEVSLAGTNKLFSELPFTVAARDAAIINTLA
jgi:hypothetical protein